VVWIPLGAWIGALVLAVVVLGFCAYEIVWKAKRLQADLIRLQTLNEQVAPLQARLAEAQARIAAVGGR
jgi:hypothetical protein